MFKLFCPRHMCNIPGDKLWCVKIIALTQILRVRAILSCSGFDKLLHKRYRGINHATEQILCHNALSFLRQVRTQVLDDLLLACLPKLGTLHLVLCRAYQLIDELSHLCFVPLLQTNTSRVFCYWLI
nr:MAG TPA: hypothetical protein [Herelleviridae sp.]